MFIHIYIYNRCRNTHVFVVVIACYRRHVYTPQRHGFKIVRILCGAHFCNGLAHFTLDQTIIA